MMFARFVNNYELAILTIFIFQFQFMNISDKIAA